MPRLNWVNGNSEILHMETMWDGAHNPKWFYIRQRPLKVDTWWVSYGPTKDHECEVIGLAAAKAHVEAMYILTKEPE